MMMKLPVLNYPQPVATLIALGLKQHLVFDHETNHRGAILIYATQKKMSKADFDLLFRLRRCSSAATVSLIPPFHFPFVFGAIIAKCELVDCLSTTDFTPFDPVDRTLDNYQVDRWAWRLSNPKSLLITGVKPKRPNKEGFWYHDLPEVAA